MLYSDLPGIYYRICTICHRATVKIRLYFKILIFMQMFCIKKKKKKKKKNTTGRHSWSLRLWTLGAFSLGLVLSQKFLIN
jgi:hypothetical protein